MACEHVILPGGGRAIVCTSERHKLCACGRVARLECDWKVPERRSGTCDALICAACAVSPMPGKDLCPDHAREWGRWKADRAAGRRGGSDA